ncbi:MAG: nickel pincer cofactor biosynthesis protein LarC [bacterium]
MSHPHDDVKAMTQEAMTQEGMTQEVPTGNVLYLDPWTGISGDMLLASLLDADRDDGRLEAELRRTVDAMSLGATVVEVARDVERGISCTRIRVHDEGAPPLRHLADMERILESAPLSRRVRTRATEALRRLAAVEAAVHGCGVDEIHFHEVGAVDTLVDVVGTFALIEALGVEKVVVGPIPVGGGTVEIAHGRVGVPAPATVRLLEGYPIIGGPEARELTTPTGALLVGELRAEPGPLPHMWAKRVGYGAGNLRLDHGPNILRAILGQALTGTGSEETGEDRDTVIELESNLDDVSPEVIGHTCRLLRGAGALDVWTVAAGMKKDRPGIVLHVLVSPQHEQAAVETIFVQTGTLGVRRHAVPRWLAARGMVSVQAFGSDIRVKWGRWRDRLVSVAPEYEDAAAVAAATGIPLKDVMQQAAGAAWDLLAPEHLLP